jgi:prepilin signal peptidase PulO-like enzyme (type II secretory pathway)
MKKSPFRLTPYQVQFLLVVGFVTVGYALYLRYLAVELSTVALACDAGLQTMLCKSRTLATYLFKNSVFGIAALIIATLHVMRPSIVLLTLGLIAAGSGIVLYNIALSGIAIGLLILGFARPAPATA